MQRIAQGFGQEVQPLLEQWALAMYGAVMLQAQTFEAQLAALDVLVHRPESEPQSAKGWERGMRKRVAHITHLLEKATPESIYRRLDGRIPDDLLREIRYMIDWRNTLAHPYLRQRLIRPALPRIAPPADMPLELLQTHLAFARLNERIEAAKREALVNGRAVWPPFRL